MQARNGSEIEVQGPRAGVMSKQVPRKEQELSAGVRKCELDKTQDQGPGAHGQRVRTGSRNESMIKD